MPQLPYGFTSLECPLLVAFLLFTGFVVWRMFRSGGGDGPRWGG